MQDQLVSFEVAKLAKEKGFDVPVWDYFRQAMKVEEGCNPHRDNYNKYTIFSRPPQSLLQRWLREVHKLQVYVDIDVNSEWSFSIYSLDSKRNSEVEVAFSYHSTYEEALEHGLKQALLLIKQNKN